MSHQEKRTIKLNLTKAQNSIIQHLTRPPGLVPKTLSSLAGPLFQKTNKQTTATGSERVLGRCSSYAVGSERLTVLEAIRIDIELGRVLIVR